MCFAVAAAVVVIPGRTFSVCGAFSVVGPKLHVHVSCFVPKPKPKRCIMHSTLEEQLFPLCNCLAPFSLRPPSDEMNVVGFMLVVHYFTKAFLIFLGLKSSSLSTSTTFGCRQSGSYVQYIKLLTITASPWLNERFKEG